MTCFLSEPWLLATPAWAVSTHHGSGEAPPILVKSPIDESTTQEMCQTSNSAKTPLWGKTGTTDEEGEQQRAVPALGDVTRRSRQSR